MNVNRSSSGPDLSDLPANFTTWYYASQYFNPHAGADVHVIATYEYNNEAGMVAFEYENGTVFLSSPHPEYEEDSDRDDTDFGDYLEDPDSEWDLLLSVSIWLIETSPYVPTSTITTIPSATSTTTSTNITTTTNELEGESLDLPLIVGATTSIAILGVVLPILYRRRN